MDRRDFGVLILAVLTICISLRQDEAFEFEKSWMYRFEDRTHLLRDRQRTPPPPIVADLNGDGRPETLVATPHGGLAALGSRPPGKGFAPPLILAEIDASPTAPGRPLAALAAGTLERPRGELVYSRPRAHVATLGSNLALRLLDPSLKQVWLVDVARFFSPGAQPVDASLHVGPYSIGPDGGAGPGGASGAGGRSAGGSGAGGRPARPPPSGVVLLSITAAPPDRSLGGGLGLHLNPGRRPAPFGGDRAATPAGERESAVMAFDGATGDLLWRHEVAEFDPVAAGELGATLAGAGAAAGASEAHAHARREASCREFRAALVDELPHRYHGAWDSRVGVAAFYRRRADPADSRARLGVGGGRRRGGGDGGPAGAATSAAAVSSLQSGAASDAAARRRARAAQRAATAAGGDAGHDIGGGFSAVPGFDGAGLRGLSGGGGGGGDDGHPADPWDTGARPAATPSTRPDVVVAHLRDGVEVLALRTGRPVCRVYFASDALHEDVDADGVPEMLVARASEPGALGGAVRRRGHGGPVDGAPSDGCGVLSARGGVPPRHHRFNASLCDAGGGASEGRTRAWGRATAGLDADAGAGDARASGGGLAHALSFAPVATLPVLDARGGVGGREKRVLALSSRGTVTAVTARGEVAWSVDAGAVFPPPLAPWRRAAATHRDHVPTLGALALRTHATPTVVLAAGSRRGTVLGFHGQELASFDLPFPPAAPLAQADLDGDGLVDLVLFGEAGVAAWTQVRGSGAQSLPFSALIATLVVILVVVFAGQEGFSAGDGLAPDLSAAAAVPPGLGASHGLGQGAAFVLSRGARETRAAPPAPPARATHPPATLPASNPLPAAAPPRDPPGTPVPVAPTAPPPGRAPPSAQPRHPPPSARAGPPTGPPARPLGPASVGPARLVERPGRAPAGAQPLRKRTD